MVSSSCPIELKRCVDVGVVARKHDGRMEVREIRAKRGAAVAGSGQRAAAAGSGQRAGRPTADAEKLRVIA